MAPIHQAIYYDNTEALRRELERGVSPDMRDDNGDPPLITAVQHKRADCVSMLLQWGADPNANKDNNAAVTVLHLASYYGVLDCVRMLLEGGAAVNARLAAREAPPAIKPWLPIDYARFGSTNLKTRRAVYALLLRAGSELPTELSERSRREDPYLSRIMDAGSFKAYERAHLAALAKTLSPKLALPPGLVRTVVEFYLHAGFYPFTAARAPAAAPTA